MNTENTAEAYARNTDPETSHLAARSISGKCVTKIEAEVLGVILSSGSNGATVWEIESMTGIRNGSVSPRTAPLCRKGLIVNSGKRRKGDSTRLQTVWIAGNGEPISKPKKPSLLEQLKVEVKRLRQVLDVNGINPDQHDLFNPPVI